MKLSVGIVGLPNVGKSTLFSAITNNEVHIANYPFATIDPNVGVVSVPDKRLEELSRISNSAQTIPAVVEFYDIAGLVKGANKGEGLGNQFLNHIRETSVIVQVVRCFKKEDIIHVEESIDPIRDITTVNTELILKDLETVQKRLDKAVREAKSGEMALRKDADILQKVFDALNDQKMASTLPEEILTSPSVVELNLLTAKEQIYLLNGDRVDIDPNTTSFLDSLGSAYVIADLSEHADLSALIAKAYEALGLISFFTSGEKETRAWTIKKDAKAPEAAGTIHTDFEKNFIRAEVIGWEEFVKENGWVNARKKGLVRVEGKEYVVQDGDVIIVRHG